MKTREVAIPASLVRFAERVRGWLVGCHYFQMAPTRYGLRMHWAEYSFTHDHRPLQKRLCACYQRDDGVSKGEKSTA